MDPWFTDIFSQDIFKTKYQGDSLDVRDFYRRLAGLVSLGDQQLATRFFRLMWEKRFSPGGRILAFGGRPDANISLMNCTTHQVEGDSLEDINLAAYTIMRASSRGQGIDIDISKLRPAGTPVNNAARTSTGAISFMEMLNSIGGAIGQEGRRGALLFSIADDHPDLYRPEDRSAVCPKCGGAGCNQCVGGYLPYDFLHVKRIPGKVESANISVRVSDRFMQAVKDGHIWTLLFEGKTGGQPFEHFLRVRAAYLFRELARCAHASAEPGLLYWDTSKKMSNSNLFGEQWSITGVNACSEQVLDQDGVCNLGSINLAAYVDSPFSDDAWFDADRFVEDVRLAVHFLDNVVSLELDKGVHTNGRQRASLVHLRRLGLGVMGLADALAMLCLPYSSSADTTSFLHKLFQMMRDTAYQASIDLARMKGPAEIWNTADDYHGSVVNGGFFQMLPQHLRQDILRYGTRNITVLSFAPTGTISNLLGVSSGIEPLFAHEYVRRTRIHGYDELVNYTHPGVCLSRSMSLPDSIWPTAYDVSVDSHLLVQSIVQFYNDSAVSKTLNFPASATVEDIEKAYMMGWQQGLKGMSVYRDGSRDIQILYKKEEHSGGCEACGEELVHKEGCVECPTCGWGKCTI